MLPLSFYLRQCLSLRFYNNRLAIMSADDGEFSMHDLKAQMEAQLEAARRAQLATSSAAVHPHAKSAAEMTSHRFTWSECRKFVQDRDGPFNWMLLEPDVKQPKLMNAGSQGLPEMFEYLDTSRVLYGAPPARPPARPSRRPCKFWDRGGAGVLRL
eukprot:SAG22_NODE_110_length_19679_cov_45.046527_14_plen_156_part_00